VVTFTPDGLKSYRRQLQPLCANDRLGGCDQTEE
jgi:hypothetical protein